MADKFIDQLDQLSALSSTCWLVVQDTSFKTSDAPGGVVYRALTSLFDPAGAAAAVLPSQSGQSGKVLSTNGTNAFWATPTGGAGDGESTAPDNLLPRLTTSKILTAHQPSVDFFTSFPSSGNAVTLLELASGSVGEVVAVQMTTGGAGDGSVSARLRIFADQEVIPSVDVDLGTLFLSHLDAKAGTGQLVGTDNLQVGMVGGGSDECSYQLQFPIPYSDGIKIEVYTPAGVTVPGGSSIFSSIFYKEGVASPLRLRSHGRTYLEANAAAAIVNTADDVLFEMPNCAGWAVWISNTSFGATGYTYLERPWKWYIDGESDPSYIFTGGEEFGATGYYFCYSSRFVQPAVVLTGGHNSNNTTIVGVDLLKMHGGVKFGNALKLVVSNKPDFIPSTNHKMAFACLYYVDTRAPFAPSAPRNLAASPGSSQVVLSWDAPASSGSAPITGYTLTTNPGGATHAVAADQTGYTVTGLSATTAYTFGLTATNSVGTGASATANATTSGATTVPGSPTIGTATAGVLSASVTFTAPSSDGGSTITGYTATSSPGGFTGTVSGATASPITVSGLTAGTAYTFTVTAVNAIGTSDPSAASNSVTPTASSGTIASDDFNRSDSATLGNTPIGNLTPALVATTGTITAAIVSNEVQLTFTDVAYGLVKYDAGVSDYSISIKLAEIGSYPYYAQVVARFTDSNNFMFIQYNAVDYTGTAYGFYKKVGGAYTALATIAVTPNAGDILKLKVTGTTVEGFVNGTSYGSFTVPELGSTASACGFGCSAPNPGSPSVRFDDLLIES